MDVSTPPSLDLACPQAKDDNNKCVPMFIGRGVDNNKIRTWRHHDYSHNNNIYRFCHMITYVQVMIYSQCKSINHKPYWAPTNYNLSH